MATSSSTDGVLDGIRVLDLTDADGLLAGQILADLGYSPGAIDGTMGDATSSAISAFQHDRKVAQTGTITPELLDELERVTGRDTSKLAER